MISINPYLNFAGNTEEAFTFYKSVFGGEFSMLQRFKDTPEAGRVPDGDRERIMHVSLPIGSRNSLMATDALESMGHKLSVGNNISLSVESDTKEETERIFRGLSAGGKVTVPLADTFWGAYFGMVSDRYGVQWMVSCPESRQQGHA